MGVRSDDQGAHGALTSALAGLPLRRPLPLVQNRVARFYRGGALLDAFRGVSDPRDGDRPEDWVGSVTRAWRPPGTPPADEGRSRIAIDGLELALADLVEARGEDVAGPAVTERWGATTGLLVKLLDAGIRLPVHCHPSRSFAERVLGSPFGKAEAWLFLGTRRIPGDDPPHIRIGWRRDIDARELRGWIERQDSEAILDAMHRVDVAPGDAWFVPPGTPHAIGAGAFIVELQEPTDFSIVAETRDFPVDANDASLRLGWDTAIEAFDLRGRSAGAHASLRHMAGEPSPVPGGSLGALLGDETADYFRAVDVRLDGEAPWPLPDTFASLVVTAGGAALEGADGTLAVRRGSTVAIPAVASGTLRVAGADRFAAIACLPPGAPLPAG